MQADLAAALARAGRSGIAKGPAFRPADPDGAPSLTAPPMRSGR